MTRSDFGARLRAIRDDERLARSLGINVLLHQLLLFELTAVIAGIAGALLLVNQQAITPDLFGALQFIPIYLAIMIGGLAVIAGPALGAWIAQFLPLWIGSEDPNISLLIYGLVLIGAMLLVAQGDPRHDPVLGPARSQARRQARRGRGAAAPGLPPPPARPARADRSGAEVLLETAGVKRWFGANRALDGVDLTVRSGEIRGLIGPNGSGKTTLLNCISGFLPLTDGTVSYRGEKLNGHGPDRIARMGLVRTFQEPEGFASFTVRETCELIAGPARTRSGANDRLPERPDELLAACGLDAVAATHVTDLPHGQLRLLGVLAAVACRPYVLLLDEPAAGLAATDAVALRDLILSIRELGVTVVVIDHDMSFLLPICDSVTVLDGGTKLAEGDPEGIASDPSVIAAYLGESFARRNTGSKVAGAARG